MYVPHSPEENASPDILKCMLDVCWYLSGPRQQENGATHVIDASAVYGSHTSTLRKLRSFSQGRMIVQNVGYKVLLPPTDNCQLKSQAQNSCPFKAGDGRVVVTRK